MDLLSSTVPSDEATISVSTQVIKEIYISLSTTTIFHSILDFRFLFLQEPISIYLCLQPSETKKDHFEEYLKLQSFLQNISFGNQDQAVSELHSRFQG